MHFLERAIIGTVFRMECERSITAGTHNVMHALKQQGMTLYGFETV